MITLAAIALLQSQTLNPEIKVDHKSRHGYYSYKYSYPVFPASHKLNPLLNKESIFPVTRAKRQFLSLFREEREKPHAEWKSELYPVLSYNSNQLVSLLFDEADYTGGAHPNMRTVMINIALIDGQPQKISLKDILNAGYETETLITKMVVEKVNVLRKLRECEPVEELPRETDQKFLISKNGLTFIFDHYSLGAFAEGNFIVKLKWSELRGKINERLIPESAL